MRANMLTVVTDALSIRTAVPAVTVYDFTTAQAVVSASESAGRPIILLVAPKAATEQGGMRFIRALRGLADDAVTPVCVQLDHATDLDLMLAAIAAGADAVLADGSAQDHERNAALVRGLRRLAGPDIVIEAELGDLAGDEDVAVSSAARGLTDPDAVADFLTSSGADLLAVAVGNVHGHYRDEPKLEWDRIERIRSNAGGTPLVLHGASGIPRASLERAAGAGIGKINMNTELRSTLFTMLGASVEHRGSEGLNLLALLQDWSRAAAGFATEAHTMTTATDSAGVGNKLPD